MILTASAIKSEVLKGRIVIDPFSSSCLNPNSYNFHLGDELLAVESEGIVDSKRVESYTNPMVIDEDGLVLEVGRLYLGRTVERIGSPHYVTSLQGRSSIGRLGLFLQIDADLGHQGAIHAWTLELTPVIPIRVYPGMVIGQVTFWQAEGRPSLYSGDYASADAPLPAKSFKG